MGFVGIMLFFSKKRVLSLICFLLAGVIGILSFRLPIDNFLILFPIFSGFFALPVLLIQMKNRAVVPKQNVSRSTIEARKIAKPVMFGSLGGIVSGLLPGVGSSEIAGLATIDKNDRSFLITQGAITTANVLLSFLALWLIGHPRSGVALAVKQFMGIGASEFLFIVVIAVISAAIGVLLTLFLAKRIIRVIEKIDYSLISKIIFSLIVILAFYFTGLAGLFLAGLCCALGMVVNLANIKRGLLMGVLILPTILFYLGV
jgi:putative membrane protein